MKKLMFVALAAASTVAFAHDDVTAPVDGFYDVTLTQKYLGHTEKTVSKTFKTSTSKGKAMKQFKEYIGSYTNLAGFTVLEGAAYFSSEDEDVSPIKIKFSYFDYTEKNGVKTYKTKVYSKTEKGVYDAESGKVYIWSTANKYSLDNDDVDTLVPASEKKTKKGYRAYEYPIAMHKQFVKTDDNKAAGGFLGGSAETKYGEKIDLTGLTAFGSGTYDKNGYVKSVSGNLAVKVADPMYGCYGTWKVNRDATSSKNYTEIKDVLYKKGCVELIEEAQVK